MLVQGSEKKLRPIDDCLESQLNFAYTSTSYLKLQDIDYIVGLGMRIADAVSTGGECEGSGAWLGKCLDLSKAYKQLAIRPEHCDLGVIFFHERNGHPRYYVANSLMLEPQLQCMLLTESAVACGICSTRCWLYLVGYSTTIILCLVLPSWLTMLMRRLLSC